LETQRIPATCPRYAKMLEDGIKAFELLPCWWQSVE
jgi:hypothetical protein